MTELEMQTDKEIGNDTEYMRVTFLKYVNFGKQIAQADLEAKGLYTLEQVNKMSQAAAGDTAHALIEEFQLIMKEAKAKQDEIESVHEDKAFADMQADENGKVSKEEFGKLLDNVDSLHAAVLKERDEKFKALFEKYFPTA